MLKSFNRKLNSEKFGYFSWIAKIKSATFSGKSLITKVASTRTSFSGVLNRKNNSEKISTLKVQQSSVSSFNDM